MLKHSCRLDVWTWSKNNRRRNRMRKENAIWTRRKAHAFFYVCSHERKLWQFIKVQTWFLLIHLSAPIIKTSTQKQANNNAEHDTICAYMERKGNKRFLLDFKANALLPIGLRLEIDTQILNNRKPTYTDTHTHYLAHFHLFHFLLCVFSRFCSLL